MMIKYFVPWCVLMGVISSIQIVNAATVQNSNVACVSGFEPSQMNKGHKTFGLHSLFFGGGEVVPTQLEFKDVDEDYSGNLVNDDKFREKASLANSFVMDEICDAASANVEVIYRPTQEGGNVYKFDIDGKSYQVVKSVN